MTSDLEVKKATRGKAGSWVSVKTLWVKRFGWQLCCRERERERERARARDH